MKIEGIISDKEYINALEDVLIDLLDLEECYYDRHGYCQAHYLDPKPCPVERGKVLIRSRNESNN